MPSPATFRHFQPPFARRMAWGPIGLHLLCLFAAASAAAVEGPMPDKLVPGKFVDLTWTSPAGGELKYSLYATPGCKPKEKLPLVVYLHGGGPCKDWIHHEIDPIPTADHNFVILLPLCPEGQTCWENTGWGTGSHRMSAEPTPGLRMVHEVIGAAIDKLGLDQDRIYLHGNSNGGYGTWDAAARWPELFAGIVPVCGGGDPSQAARLKDMPIWAFHCRDDNVVPFSGTEEMIDAIIAAGGSPKYTYTDDGGHHAWEKAWAEKDLFPWLFKQVRKSAPASGPAPKAMPGR